MVGWMERGNTQTRQHRGSKKSNTQHHHGNHSGLSLRTENEGMFSNAKDQKRLFFSRERERSYTQTLNSSSSRVNDVVLFRCHTPALTQPSLCMYTPYRYAPLGLDGRIGRAMVNVAAPFRFLAFVKEEGKKKPH